MRCVMNATDKQNNAKLNVAEVRALIEWLRGKVGRKDAIGAVARHVRDRPGHTPDLPWRTLEDLRKHARFFAPDVSQDEITAAVAEFQAAA